MAILSSVEVEEKILASSFSKPISSSKGRQAISFPSISATTIGVISPFDPIPLAALYTSSIS